MARPKRSPEPLSSAPDDLEGAVGDLTAEVRTLAQQVEVLRIAVDDLREELQFAIRNLPREPWVPTQPITSLPRDPLTNPFPVNRTRREDVPHDAAEMAPPPVEKQAVTSNSDAGLGELF